MFLTSAKAGGLLALALDHPSADVQIEAAFAAGKTGRASGARWLARMCLIPHLSGRAKHYLREFGCEYLIPAESENEEFRAKAEFAEWLAHPAELGRPPDDLEVLDHRMLAWPPGRELRSFWLIKYRIGGTPDPSSLDVGVGLVGSVTFCFFTYELERRPPEDAYAIHCYWEMQHRALIEEADAQRRRAYQAAPRSMPDEWSKAGQSRHGGQAFARVGIPAATCRAGQGDAPRQGRLAGHRRAAKSLVPSRGFPADDLRQDRSHDSRGPRSVGIRHRRRPKAMRPAWYVMCWDRSDDHAGKRPACCRITNCPPTALEPTHDYNWSPTFPLYLESDHSSYTSGTMSSDFTSRFPSCPCRRG